jgi:hypothetical protein
MISTQPTGGRATEARHRSAIRYPQCRRWNLSTGNAMNRLTYIAIGLWLAVIARAAWILWTTELWLGIIGA